MEVGFCQEERNVRYAIEQERSREKKLLSLRLNAFTILWRKTLLVCLGKRGDRESSEETTTTGLQKTGFESPRDLSGG